VSLVEPKSTRNTNTLWRLTSLHTHTNTNTHYRIFVNSLLVPFLTGISLCIIMHWYIFFIFHFEIFKFNKFFFSAVENWRNLFLGRNRSKAILRNFVTHERMVWVICWRRFDFILEKRSLSDKSGCQAFFNLFLYGIMKWIVGNWLLSNFFDISVNVSRTRVIPVSSFGFFLSKCLKSQSNFPL